ncbi:PadR family transcriptional regulator [Rhodococcus pyridinivorans]|uniref:PadR family transcriptional regulator n=1 Tax=Rhodococcus pyridinivorans TaxID=103816 RepID=UPI0037C76542
MISVTSANLIDASLLMLVAERPDHGYALLDRLQIFGMELGDDLGVLYRRLHSLERRGLVEHQLSRSNKGPRRKVYQATPLGVRALHDWACSLRATHEAITHWLDANVALLDPRPEMLMAKSS